MKRTILSALLLAIFLINPFSASALISSGVGETKEDAIAEAKRNAIENSLSKLISPAEYRDKYESLSNNLFNNIDDYLEDYKILREEKRAAGVRVTINIEVKTAKIKKLLSEKEGWIATYEESNVLALFLKRTTRHHLSGRSKEARYAYAEFKGILENEFGYEVIRNSLIERESGPSKSRRRSRRRVKSMEQKDAIEMAADMGAGYAIFFDLKIDKKREKRTQIVTCIMNISIYDAENNRLLNSYEIEGDAEQDSQRRSRHEEPGDAVLDAIQTVVDLATLKAHSLFTKNSAASKRVRKYDLILKNFKQDEIQLLIKEFKAMDKFSRLRQIKQTARTYQAEIFAALNRNDFLNAMKNILTDSNFSYNLNFDRNKVYISKFRKGKKTEEEEAGYIAL